jgi:hypothetical protein
MNGCNVYRIQPQQAAYVAPDHADGTDRDGHDGKSVIFCRSFQPIPSILISTARISAPVEMQTIDRVAREINTYHPDQVTVSWATPIPLAPRIITRPCRKDGLRLLRKR